MPSNPQPIPGSSGTASSSLSLGPRDPWLPANYASLNHALDFAVIQTWKYHKDYDSGESTWTELPSLECLEIVKRVGSSPPMARFRYRFGDGNFASPQTWEQALGGVGQSQAVNPGDRLVVIATQVIRSIFPPGSKSKYADKPEVEILFDGKPFGFDGTLSAEGGSYHETAGLLAIGSCKTALDIPIGGALYRDASKPFDPSSTQTGLRPIFNEGGIGNSTLATNPDTGGTADELGNKNLQTHYPIFIDPNIRRTPAISTFFVLPGAVAYLMYGGIDQAVQALEDAGDTSDAAGWLRALETPIRDDLDKLLVAKTPVPSKTFDPSDSDTYTTDDLIVPNTPIGGRPWPTSTEAIVGDKGFLFLWRLDTDTTTAGENPEPKWSVAIQPTNEGPTKDLYLQARGSDLDDDKSYTSSLSFTRDLADAPNHWIVEGAPKVHEIAAVLAWDGDWSTFAGNPDDLAKSSPNFHDNRNIWRKHVFGETGNGYCVPYGATGTTPPDLKPVLGGGYVVRGRPGLGHLVTRGGDGEPLQAQLFYSTDYDYANKPPPRLWDTTGTWTEVTSGEWGLLEDELGIYLTCDHPNNLRLGKKSDDEEVFANYSGGGATGSADLGAIVFLLVVAIEGDSACSGEAKRRTSAALPNVVQRRVDASDRYKTEIVSWDSWYNRTSSDIIHRDDSSAATAEAVAMRDASDSGILDGPVVIPRFTTYYQPGDRIKSVNGRQLSLRTDGDEASPAAIVPIVMSVTYHFDGGQSVSLELADANVSRGRRRRR